MADKHGDVTIAPAAFEDVEAILALQKLAYRSEAAIYDDYTIQPLVQTLEEIQEEFHTHLFLKATEGDRVVGSVRAREADGACHIGKLIVHPDCQGQGIGTRLMREVEGRFDHVARFELFTGHQSARNLYLYDKLGYRAFKTVPVSDAVSIVYLEKFP
jgi:ribosomal protein S18 acetylase RimI-like enzyme